MRYITELELRELFADGFPASYTPPSGARLTPAARQYLGEHGLYREDGAEGCGYAPAVGGAAIHAAPFYGDPCPPGGCPTASPPGQKPEYMTHLTRTQMTCKTDPRIELRGRLDSLEAEIILCQTEAPAAFQAPLEDALRLVRMALASDVKEERLPDWRLDGMTAQQVHHASHHPEALGYTGHIVPSAAQGRFPALLNRLRTQTRECELCAMRAYWHGDRLERGDLILTLNRLSSYFYVLQLRAAADKR